MYLTKCHIENFGKFSNRDFLFNNGLNVINEQNGWGKTTLSIFIKVMFYGATASRKSNLDENDRALYTPFNGGKYGGYVEFVHQGKPYRIERYFGKTISDDEVLLLDLTTGKRFENENGKSFGDRLFGINVDVFIRTLFLSQKDIDLSNNNCISDQIGSVYQNAEDDDVNKAIKKLDEKRLSLKGKYGRIDAKKEEITNLKSSILRCEQASRGADVIENDICELKKEIRHFESEKSRLYTLAQKVREVEGIASRASDYDDKLNKKAEYQKYVDNVCKVFNNQPVTRNDINDKISKHADIVALTKNTQLLREDLTKKENKKKEIISSYNSYPTANTLNKLRNLLSEKEMLISQKHDSTYNEISHINEEKADTKFSFIFIGVGGALLALGIVLFVLSLFTPAIILSALGAIGLIVGLIQFINSSIKNSAVKASELSRRTFEDATKKEREANLVKIDSLILMLKKDLGLEALSDKNALIKLSEDLTLIEQYDSYVKNHITDLSEKENSLRELILTESAFFSSLNLPIELTDLDKGEVFNKLNEYLIGKENALRFINELDRDIENLKQKGINLPDELKSINKEETDLAYNNVLEKIDELSRNLAIKEKNKADCFNAQEREIEFNEALLKAKEDLAELERTLLLTIKTKEYLILAREELALKYLQPIKDGINKYLIEFTGKTPEELVVNSEYGISVTTSGQTKGLEYASRGWKNIYALALRFSFIDQVFSQEENSTKNPFVILDDPFINFDNENLKLSLKAIENFAKDRQIIYFVCHDSRSI